MTSIPETDMTRHAHTPGPWHWVTAYALRPTNPDPRRGSVHTILEVEHWSYGFMASDIKQTLAEGEANARLIAAAPDLLAALRQTLAALTCCAKPAQCKGLAASAREAALAAIARVEGCTAMSHDMRVMP